MFRPTRKFKRRYDHLFKKNPTAANLYLLLCELAGPDGKVVFPGNEQIMTRELRDLMIARFEDPRRYAL